MRGIKIAGRVLSTLLTVLLVLLLAFNLYTIIARAITGNPQPTMFGYSAAVVVSGSMEPTISIDDMVINHAQEQYAVGDIVTFQKDGLLVTHRITRTTENGFITKGDANNTEDLEQLLPEQIVGKVIWSIPNVGIIMEYLRTPLGMTCLVLIGFLLIAAPGWLERRKAEKINSGGNEDAHS